MQIVFTVPGEPGVEYRPIEGFDGYMVGNDGSVWSCKSLNGVGVGQWHRLSGFVGRGDYLRVNLRRNGKIEKRSIHRLVLDAFIGPQPELEARHGNANRQDNRLTNLEWGTALENAEDRERHGHTLRGTNHGMAKLTENQVREVKALAGNGLSKTAIAARYGIGRTTLGHILNGKNWRHIS